jgi:hypothetical protein
MQLWQAKQASVPESSYGREQDSELVAVASCYTNYKLYTTDISHNSTSIPYSWLTSI